MTGLTRRLLLGAALAGAGGLMLPRRIWAATTLDLGSGRLDTLSDGHLQLAADAPAIPCNVTLWREGDRIVLIDAGGGHDFVPTLGKLPEALAALELSPEDITHVVFTHGHPDHLWGVLDEFDEPTFPNAALLIGAVEQAAWLDPATLDALPEDRKSFAAGAARRLNALADRFQTFADGDEVLPGLVARMTPGHTPGHMSFRVGTGADAALVLGDVATSVDPGFTAPATPGPTDQDPALAAATRQALLAELAGSGSPVIGFHLPDGGVGRVVAGDAAGSYRFEAAA